MGNTIESHIFRTIGLSALGVEILDGPVLHLTYRCRFNVVRLGPRAETGLAVGANQARISRDRHGRKFAPARLHRNTNVIIHRGNCGIPSYVPVCFISSTEFFVRADESRLRTKIVSILITTVFNSMVPRATALMALGWGSTGNITIVGRILLQHSGPDHTNDNTLRRRINAQSRWEA